MNAITWDLPPKLAPILKPYRVKTLYGGRGGGKTESFARLALKQGMDSPTRFLCVREYQNSVKKSVYKILVDLIDEFELHHFYHVTNDAIISKRPDWHEQSEFIFAGVKNDVSAIRSMANINVAWCEEASSISENSWRVLTPTIREKGSEIWISFNPEMETDYTYQRYVLNAQSDELVIKVNYDDNPWFPDELKRDMEIDKKLDYDNYKHVWMGEPRSFLSGAVYQKQILQAEQEGRIRDVPYTKGKLVSTFWDLGYRDSTAIWFCQMVDGKYNIIDYLEENQEDSDYYVQLLQGKRYAYAMHYLPHDADKHSGTGRTWREVVADAYPGRVTVLPADSKTEGINAARLIFPLCHFDQSKTLEGLQCLRRYRYKDNTNILIHNHWSHGADAFRYLAMSMREHPGLQKANMNKIHETTKALQQRPMFNQRNRLPA